MELSQDEKNHIIAEEKLRFETIKQLRMQEGGGWGGHGKECNCGGHAKACGCGCHGHGYGFGGSSCHCGGFWKGLILGLLLSALFSFCFHHKYYGHNDGRCYFGSPSAQNSEPAEPQKK